MRNTGNLMCVGLSLSKGALDGLEQIADFR